MGWTKGKPRSAATRAKIAEAARRRAEDPDYLQRQAQAMRQRWADPVTGEKLRLARRAREGLVPPAQVKTYRKMAAVVGRAAALRQLGLAPC